mgnify:CR=1 FL=1
MVPHPGGSTSYSDGFERFTLDRADGWADNLERFCAQMEVSCLYGVSTRGRVREAIFPDNVADLRLLLGRHTADILVQDAGNQRLGRCR